MFSLKKNSLRHKEGMGCGLIAQGKSYFVVAALIWYLISSLLLIFAPAGLENLAALGIHGFVAYP